MPVRRWQQWLGTSRFARNIWQVARANVLAQVLPVAAAPLLTRLYSPDDFGALALCASVLSVALALATGRFEWSMPNARGATMAAALAACAAALLLPGCLLLALLLWAAAHGAAPTPSGWAAHADVWAGAAWLLPVALLGGGLQQVLQAWHVRTAELAAVGRAKVAQGLANVAVSLAVPLAGWLAGRWLGGSAAGAALPGGAGAWGLLLGLLAGAWVGLRPLWRAAPGLPVALRRLSPRRLRVAWRRFAGEAAWSTLASLANTASFAVIPLLLARHFSAAEVGLFALMQRVAFGPVGLVGNAVNQSFWAEAARLVRSDPAALARLYWRSTRRLAWFALPMALLALAGPLYVGPLFGAEHWQRAGWVLAASVPMLLGIAVASPLSHLVIHRKQHWQAIWDVARVLLLTLSIEALGRAGAGLAATVLGLSTVMGAMYVVLVGLNFLALRAARSAHER